VTRRGAGHDLSLEAPAEGDGSRRGLRVAVE
jgi:hypothetical protein